MDLERLVCNVDLLSLFNLSNMYSKHVRDFNAETLAASQQQSKKPAIGVTAAGSTSSIVEDRQAEEEPPLISTYLYHVQDIAGLNKQARQSLFRIFYWDFECLSIYPISNGIENQDSIFPS
jgi:uncharacterized protein (UPF0261 family)